MAKCTYIDGIGSSQAIDTAGEIVDIKGLDCSSLIGGAFNWEHKADVPAQLVGKVLDYKKIFSEADCDNDRQLKYWKKCQIPFLYVMGRLLDDKKESAKEVAALLLDDAEHPNEPPMVGFSIEGAKIAKEGMTITRSIARKVTITNCPANKTCLAEMIPASKTKSKGDFDSLFKGQVTFFTPDSKYMEFLNKREEELEKDVGSGGGAFIGDSMAMNEMAKSVGWTHSGGGNFNHPEHGTVSVIKHPSGQFHVKHNGTNAGLGGQKGVFNTAAEAGKHAGNYMSAVSSGKVHAPVMHNVSSNPTIAKAMTAGSSMGAPSSLVGGAALGVESLDGKKKNKSAWLQRAEQAYKVWEKKEHFENFMSKKMPHLTKGEIKAIGQTLALKKSIEAEGKLDKMFSSYFGKTTDILMANEKKKKV